MNPEILYSNIAYICEMYMNDIIAISVQSSTLGQTFIKNALLEANNIVIQIRTVLMHLAVKNGEGIDNMSNVKSHIDESQWTPLDTTLLSNDDIEREFKQRTAKLIEILKGVEVDTNTAFSLMFLLKQLEDL